MTSERHEREDPFLTAIEAKIAAWKAVAESYRAAVSLDGQLGDHGAGASVPIGRPMDGSASTPMGLPIGVFRNKSIKEAIQIYLGAGHRKQTNKEIATGLKDGGIPTTAANFEATVATALHRMKDDNTVLRFPDGWDLASSYPDGLRSRLEKDAKPSRRRRPKVKKAKGPAGRVGPTRAKQAMPTVGEQAHLKAV